MSVLFFSPLDWQKCSFDVDNYSMYTYLVSVVFPYIFPYTHSFINYFQLLFQLITCEDNIVFTCLMLVLQFQFSWNYVLPTAVCSRPMLNHYKKTVSVLIQFTIYQLYLARHLFSFQFDVLNLEIFKTIKFPFFASSQTDQPSLDSLGSLTKKKAI